MFLRKKMQVCLSTDVSIRWTSRRRCNRNIRGGAMDTAPCQKYSSVHPFLYLNIKDTKWAKAYSLTSSRRSLLLNVILFYGFTYVAPLPPTRILLWPIFTKIASAWQQLYSDVLYRISPYIGKINVEIKDINLFTSEIKYKFHCANFHKPHNAAMIFCTPPVRNLIQVGRKVCKVLAKFYLLP
jgi:hypothetical protein